MRELNLIARLIGRIEHEGRRAGAVRISSVRLRVGECAGVRPAALVLAFQRLAVGTIAQGAGLEIEVLPLESSCEVCGCRFRVVQFSFECPYCGSCRTRVVAGEDVVLESVTVVTAYDPSLTRVH